MVLQAFLARDLHYFLPAGLAMRQGRISAEMAGIGAGQPSCQANVS